MNHIYIRSIYLLLTLFVLVPGRSHAQCANGDPAFETGFDTTINFSSGRLSAILRFPKFDPEVAMITCARLTLTMQGRLNSLQFENAEPSTVINASAEFKRNDTLSGPGLSSPLLNEEIQPYGPYILQPDDGNFGSGPDFVHAGPEDIFTRTRSVVITNVAELADFYGPAGDSLTYNYSVNSRTTVDILGNWMGGVSTAGSITYRLEYCYCPVEILPINAFDFNVRKEDNKAFISWKANSDQQQFYYELEYSTDGRNFTSAGVIEKQSSHSGTISYNYVFEKNTVNEKYYFRLKQKFSTGRLMLSTTKSVDFGNDQSFSFSLYPNPSDGIIGIKFDNTKRGKILVSVANIQGQIILNKTIEISDNNYRQIATLQKGLYWVKVVDMANQKSSVSQLLIK